MPAPTSRDMARIRVHMPNYSPNQNHDDRVRWLLGRSGEYSCKTMWEEIRIKFPNVSSAPLNWNKGNIPRCSFIAWLACKGRMRTKEKLFQWGVVADSTCALCGTCVETIDHLFFQCSYAWQVWSLILS